MFSMLPAKRGSRIISQTALGAVLVWEESGSEHAFLSCLIYFINTTLVWLRPGEINKCCAPSHSLSSGPDLILPFLGMPTPDLHDKSSFSFTLTCLSGALPVWAVESQTGLGGKDLKDHPVPTPAACLAIFSKMNEKTF